MVVPTTQRKYYDTTKKVSALAEYAGAVKQSAEAWGSVLDAQQKLKISSSLDEANKNINEEFERLAPQYDKNPESPEFKQYMDDFRKNQYEIAKQNILPIYRGQFDEAVRKRDLQYKTEYNSWQLNQASKNASEDVKKTSKNMVNEAYLAGLSGEPQAFDIAQENYREKKELIKNAAVPVLGARATDAALEDLDEKYKESLLAGMLDGNPVSLLSLAEQHKDDFDGKLVTKYKKLAEDKIKKLNVEKLNREILDAANSEGNILSMSYDHNLTMQEIQENMPENASEAFKNMVYKINGYSLKDVKGSGSKKIPAIKKAQMYQYLQDRFVYLISSPNTKLEDFQNFNNEVYTAVADEYISLSDGRQFVNDISVPTMNKWREYTKQFGASPMFGNNYGYDKLEKWIKDSVLGKEPNKKNYKNNMREYEEIIEGRARIRSDLYRRYNDQLTNIAKNKGMKNIADILSLDKDERNKIYKEATDAVRRHFGEDRFASLRDTKANPTYVLKNGSLTQVASDPEDKGQGTRLNETRVIQVRIKDGKYWAKLSDGRTSEIDFDTYKKYGGK